MQGKVYRAKVAKIVRVALNASLPGISQRHKTNAAELVAKLVHAKLYGAEVDNVQSPIWRDMWIACGEAQEPTKTSEQILIEAGNDK